ncbi:hypothetical protein [Bradyrhizobium diversitatis]|uniref:CopG family transcriptional regulator n=1 Tax=Bradyrhizobium diversitatis TaxID=2755406 RepID=A0ABS0P273_9BRAD|nr:hypothetical protein [Bradyrhizobium diversitatis]MBH5387361.1 hypothetical protein [Bradyrhizobium diversitatis]
MKKKTDKPVEIELHPDAWERFERAAEVVGKSPPQHRQREPEKSKPVKPRIGTKKD